MRDTGNIRKIINFTYTLKIYTNYKLPVFRTNVKCKFENVNLLTKPNITIC